MDHQNEILNYLEKYCRKQDVKLKEIINLDDSKEKKFFVKVISQLFAFFFSLFIKIYLAALVTNFYY